MLSRGVDDPVADIRRKSSRICERRAFELNAVDYLLKLVDNARLRETLNERNGSENRCVRFSGRTGRHRSLNRKVGRDFIENGQ